MPTPTATANADCAAIAERLVRARTQRTALARFPGAQPTGLDEAYRIQDAAIARWPDRIVGWKVGGIPPEVQPQLGATRLVGPIFAADLRIADTEHEVAFPVFEGGFAAVEAEIVFRLAVEPPRVRSLRSVAQSLALVDAVFAGVETAGSPMAAINQLGPTAVVSDFGNNFGLIVGPAIEALASPAQPIACCTSIDAAVVGEYLLQDGLQAPALALAFALQQAATRPWPLCKGDYITTGALTGIHDIRSGQQALIEFAGRGRVVCRAQAARAPVARGDR